MYSYFRFTVACHKYIYIYIHTYLFYSFSSSSGCKSYLILTE